jgi:ribonuclease P protein component
MTDASTKAGLIINKTVGGSVARHRVARQIRHALRDQLDFLPPGAHVVVRALPGSVGQDLKKDLNALILKLLEKATTKQ